MNLFREIITGIRRLFEWWVVVAPWEQALRVRLGRHVRKLESGWHFRIPLIDRIYLQSVRRRYVNLPMQTLTTRDGKTITIAGALAYAIGDIEKLYQTLHHAEGTLISTAMAAIASMVHESDSKECKPADIVQRVASELKFAQCGIADVELSILDFAIVRTFRIMQSDRWLGGGDALDTVQQMKLPLVNG